MGSYVHSLNRSIDHFFSLFLFLVFHFQLCFRVNTSTINAYNVCVYIRSHQFVSVAVFLQLHTNPTLHSYLLMCTFEKHKIYTKCWQSRTKSMICYSCPILPSANHKTSTQCHALKTKRNIFKRKKQKSHAQWTTLNHRAFTLAHSPCTQFLPYLSMSRKVFQNILLDDLFCLLWHSFFSVVSFCSIANAHRKNATNYAFVLLVSIFCWL